MTLRAANEPVWVRTSYKWPSGHSNLSPSLIGVTQGACQILSRERATSHKAHRRRRWRLSGYCSWEMPSAHHKVWSRWRGCDSDGEQSSDPYQPLHLLRAARFESDLRNRHCTWCCFMCWLESRMMRQALISLVLKRVRSAPLNLHFPGPTWSRCENNVLPNSSRRRDFATELI